MNHNNTVSIDVSREILPMNVSLDLLNNVFSEAKSKKSPVLAVVIGTKPDFYKQAPLVIESIKEKLPVFVIDTGQHYDDLLGFGIKEFELENYVACDLQIRGNLMEKASELILKFGSFGRLCREKFDPSLQMLPIVHGDTLVAGIAPLAWVFGMGQKVGQNEAGLRSMSPEIMKEINVLKSPSNTDIESFIHAQFEGKWFLAREEPFPEQIDTWICSAGTQYFFAPTELNKMNLVREGYPEEFVHVVGNSVVDAIHIKRKQKPTSSIFDIYPILESGEWIRMDIHRRENLTYRRFTSIMGALQELIKKTDKKVVLVMLNATASALRSYGLEEQLEKLSNDYQNKFVITPLWKEYSHVIEFLDSGHCWAEMTDSGSMQEELLYFPDVISMTVRLNTDRPETIFTAQSNVLVPPINKMWITSAVDILFNNRESFGSLKKKKQIYGQPGEVSKRIVRIIKKEFQTGHANFYPWLHQRINLWKEDLPMDYL